MEKSLGSHEQLFQLIPTKEIRGINSNILTIGRYLVGRTETCDVVIPAKGISAVHAVLEVTPRGVKVYDMNSKNGTLVDGNKVVAKEIALNGRIKFGTVEFILKKYSADPKLPPVLPSLEPIKGKASVLKNKPVSKRPKAPPKPKPKLPQDLPEVVDDVPYIVYPLSADPDSAYSEYIFEDTKDLYPIFKYELNQQAVEVIILFKDKVYSVDYLPEKDGLFKISGLTHRKNEVEFPYLAAGESVPFIEIHKGNCNVHQLHNYKILHLVKDDIKYPKQGTVNIQEDEIIKLINGDLEIYVRRVSSPPKVKTPPFFRRDKELRKYLILMILFLVSPLAALYIYQPDEKIKDEPDPERIATILYNQKLTVNKNKTVEATKKKPVKKQTAPKKPVVKKEKPKKKKSSQQKTEKKVTKKTTNPGSQKAAKKQKVKRVKNPAPKQANRSKTVKSASSKSKVRSASTRRATVNSKSKGNVETYKSFKFKSTVNNLMAKGGSIKGAKTAQTSSNSLSNAQVSGGVATSVNKASVGTEVGSLTGSTTGKLAETKGTSGLSTKTGTYTAGIPSETVVLGSMDPDVIRRILRDNIPFFRSCYQKGLNRNTGQDISGTIRLVFSIGSSGYVSRAGVDGRTRLPARVKSCVVGVLRGIKFPRPLGGGTVDVKQPFNFFPKKL